MTTLETIRTLRERDVICATFKYGDGTTYDIVGEVRARMSIASGFSLFVGPMMLASAPPNATLSTAPEALTRMCEPRKSVVGVDIISRAKPFYTNRGPRRRPQKGDVCTGRFGRYYFFDGEVFISVDDSITTRLTVVDFAEMHGATAFLVSEAIK